MSLELKAVTIDLKSLDQKFPDPIVAGAGDANGRTLRLIFSQEALAQLAPNTKVYLSWYNQNTDTSGLNVFKKLSDKPKIYEIQYPTDMLFEGNVLCCIKLVDEISICQSTNFLITVLADPNDGEHFTSSDDYSAFNQAMLDLSNAKDNIDAVEEQIENIKNAGEQLDNIKDIEEKIYKAQETAEKAMEEVQKATGIIYVEEF